MKNQIIAFAHALEQADDRGRDLWTWLPSYHFAQLAHGDYACEHQPSYADLMGEASQIFSRIKYGPGSDFGLHGCPCGECEYSDVHGEQVAEWFDKFYAGTLSENCE